MKIRQIIGSWSSHQETFDRINFLKLCPKVNLCDISINNEDEIYVISNGHETCQNYYDRIIMKHVLLMVLNSCLNI